MSTPDPLTDPGPAGSTDPHAWFDHARFGLFVHFGAYAIPARHEWVMSREKIAPEEYEKYVELFDPDRFDARLIARTAREAGMRYAVLTTKHHEGFCLWDSALTDYSAATSCGRDLVAEFVDALREEGLRVGFYHSLIDWHHPDFTIDSLHPLRDAPDREERNAGRDMARYRTYLHGQVRELLTGYGTIDYLFFDFTYPGEDGKGPEDWDSEGLLAMVRELQPGILVNDRLGLPGDLRTPEQHQPVAPMVDEDGNEVRWESCQTTNGSWGYHRDNHDTKSADLLLRMVVDSVGKNGNLLLNIGPDGRGGLRRTDTALLAEIGEWMDLHGDSVHGAGPARGMTAPQGTILTRRGDRVYVHLTAWPMQSLHLTDLPRPVRFARLLHDGSEIRHHRVERAEADLHAHMSVNGLAPGTVTFTLPIRRPEALLPVLEILLEPAPAG